MRIIIGVSGEGYGHATRSAVLGTYLQERGHTVLMLAGGKAYAYLAQRFPTKRIPHVPLVYRGGRLATRASISLMVRKIAPIFFQTIYRTRNIIRRFKADAVVSDFEVFTTLAAGSLRLPLIQANNNSLLAKTNAHVEGHSAAWARLVDFFATIGANEYVITSFVRIKERMRNVTITPPVIREEVRKLRARKGTHLLIYQTSSTNSWLLDVLEKTKIPCKIYGYGLRSQRGSLEFFDFNGERFLDDLASAKACIIGGGYSLLSEAIFLRKPVLCVPLRDHYEQQLNAKLLEQRGFGLWRDHPTRADILGFLKNLPRYEKQLAGYAFDPLEFCIAVENAIIRSSSTDYTARA